MSQDIGLYGLLAAVVAAISTSTVAIVRLFKTKQNGQNRVKDPVPNATQIVAALDPRDSDSKKIQVLENQLLLIREDEALKFKEKVTGLADNMAKIQTLVNDISKDLSEVIMMTGLDRAKVAALDKSIDIMKALTEYEDKRRKKGGSNGGAPIA